MIRAAASFGNLRWSVDRARHVRFNNVRALLQPAPTMRNGLHTGEKQAAPYACLGRLSLYGTAGISLGISPRREASPVPIWQLGEGSPPRAAASTWRVLVGRDEAREKPSTHEPRAVCELRNPSAPLPLPSDRLATASSDEGSPRLSHPAAPQENVRSVTRGQPDAERWKRKGIRSSK
jgi:hypothetical protein